MNRRQFGARLATVLTGSVAAFVSNPAVINWQPERVLSDRVTGMSIRFIRSYDVTSSTMVNKLDAFYGMGEIEA